MAEGAVFSALSDAEIFAHFAVGEGGRWLEGSGEVDICADALCYQAHPEAKIEKCSRLMLCGATNSRVSGLFRWSLTRAATNAARPLPTIGRGNQSAASSYIERVSTVFEDHFGQSLFALADADTMLGADGQNNSR